MSTTASTTRPASLLVSGLAALAATALTACGTSSGSGAGAASTGRETTSIISSSVTAPRTSATTAAVHPGGRAQVRVTGLISLYASGSGAFCNYFYPALKQGVAYHVSSTTLTGSSSVGGWDLSVSDDTGHSLSIILNTSHGSWTSGRAVVGTVHAQPNLHHADFDVELVKVIGQQHAHLTGSIDCP